MNSQNQSQAQNYYQNVPQQASHTLFFNDQPRVTAKTIRCSNKKNMIMKIIQ